MKRARFHVYRDKAGQYRWTLRAANGRIVADSGEGYTRKRDAERAVVSALLAAADAGSRLLEESKP